MLSVRNLVKIYQSKKAEPVTALNDVSIDFPETGLVFLLGKSGSGKSTLLNAIGGLDTFDSGEIIIKGKSSKDFSQSDFDSYRNTFIGFIFQEYNILENFTVHKNLALALELQGKHADNDEINRLLEQVEMTQYAKRKPNELSGGQKQRVAIARALVKNPEIIMADEPTGALDSNTGKQVMDTLKELSKTKLVIIVSHDREFAEIYGDRIIELKDGKILHDITKKEIEAQETASGIKVIDDNILYIKKGHQMTESDIKAITKVITENATKNDTFISFDKEANDKLKEGAKINESGNKEAFLKTEKEDIKVKQYNPDSLQLIRSRLKFSDSFKMGASALKNKVGKLIFTILLSFFAFTVFGIFDALSCWNRAESVYEAMKLNNTKTVILMKKSYNEEWKSYESDATSNADLKMLQEKFKDRTIKGVVGPRWNNIYEYRFGTSGNYGYISSSSNDPLYSTDISGFVNFTSEDIDAYGFEVIKGDLPDAADEIAISKYMMESLIKNTSTSQNEELKITEDNIIGQTDDKILRISVNGFGESSNSSGQAKIVGVVDDKTDYSKYKEMDSAQRMDEQYTIDEFFANSFMRMAYVSAERYDIIAESGVEANLRLGDDDNSWDVQKDQVYSLEYEWLTENLDRIDSSWTYYSCKIGSEHFRLEYNISGNYWYLRKLTFDDWGSENYDTLYSYEGGEIKDNDDNQALGSTEETEFYAKFGNLDSNKIPEKFEPGYYSKEAIVDKNIYYYKDGSLIDAEGNFVDIGEDAVIITKNMAEQFMGSDYEDKIAEGFTLDLTRNGRVIKTLTVVGVCKQGYYFSNECFTETIAPQFVGCNMIVTTMTGNEEADKAFITFCENGENGERWTVQNSSTGILDMFEDIIVNVAQVFFYIAIGFAVFASLMLMNFISTSIAYKKREIGVLRALGARGSDIFGIFFNESMIIAMINFVLSATATVATCLIINSVLVTKLGLDITLLMVGIRQIILILAVSVIAAFVGSFIPTFKISRKKPIDAINNR